MSPYAQNHKAAKAIMYLMINILLYLDGSLTIYGWAAITIWVFGTNVIAYAIETIRGHKHEHDKL